MSKEHTQYLLRRLDLKNYVTTVEKKISANPMFRIFQLPKWVGVELYNDVNSIKVCPKIAPRPSYTYEELRQIGRLALVEIVKIVGAAPVKLQLGLPGHNNEIYYDHLLDFNDRNDRCYNELIDHYISPELNCRIAICLTPSVHVVYFGDPLSYLPYLGTTIKEKDGSIIFNHETDEVDFDVLHKLFHL